MSKPQQLNIRNKKAKFEYHLIDEYVAGMQLWGSEVKSIKAGKASINEAYCYLKNGEVFIKNMNVSEYQQARYQNHEPKRERKLLLNKIEIQKIQKKIDQKGFTLVPLKVFISDRGYIKIRIAVAQGKKLYDKRENIKERDNKRDLDRLMKKFR